MLNQTFRKSSSLVNRETPSHNYADLDIGHSVSLQATNHDQNRKFSSQ